MADNETTTPAENNVSVEDAGTLKKKVTVTVPASSIQAKRDEMYGELSESAQIPGFRIGHAPRRLLEKRFGKEVATDVRNAVIGDSLGQSMEQAKLQPIGEPDIDLEGIELPEDGDLEYSFEIEVAPEFDLPETKGIKVDKVTNEVTDEGIEKYLEELREMRAKHEPTEDPAGDHDVVSAKTKVTVEGCEPVEKDSIMLRVAPGNVEGLPLVDLGKELTGKKADDVVEMKVTVDESHANEDWQGKEATVEITVLNVRKRILPEISEDFAKDMGFESLDAVKDFVRERMQARVEDENKRNMRQQVSQYLLDNTKFDLPEGVAARHTVDVLQRRYVELLRMGMPREKVDENLTQLQADAKEQADRELRLQFILSKVADDLNIEITDADVNSVIAQMAGQYGRRPERLRQELAADGSLEKVQMSMRDDAALDKLLEEAEVTEISAEEAEKKAEKAAPKPKAKKAAKKTAKKSAKKAEEKTEKDAE